MSQFFNIFCRSENPLTRAELGEFAMESWYGEELLVFDPSLSDEASRSIEWRSFEIALPHKKRPIAIQRDIESAAVTEMVDETLGELESKVIPVVSNHLAETRQVIGLEIFPEEFDDDAWELLDVIESYLARQCNGLIVTDDGVYNKDLECLIAL